MIYFIIKLKQKFGIIKKYYIIHEKVIKIFYLFLYKI